MPLCVCVGAHVSRQIGSSSRRDSVIHEARWQLLSASPCVTHPTSSALTKT